jgi:putative flippase GtrA
MNRKDLALGALLGFLSALVFVVVYVTIAKHPASLAIWSLVALAPLAFMAALGIGALLSRLGSVFYDFTKFILVGLLNTGVDFAVFNVLIFLSGLDKGRWIVGFKSLSFAVALLNSYFWNKLWTFKKSGVARRPNEFARYVIVTVMGFLLNVGITTLIANHLRPGLGLSQVEWDNVAAIFATVVSLLWNFGGYKLVVFKDSGALERA